MVVAMTDVAEYHCCMAVRRTGDGRRQRKASLSRSVARDLVHDLDPAAGETTGDGSHSRSVVLVAIAAALAAMTFTVGRTSPVNGLLWLSGSVMMLSAAWAALGAWSRHREEKVMLRFRGQAFPINVTAGKAEVARVLRMLGLVLPGSGQAARARDESQTDVPLANDPPRA
jgi:hypothetical protein